MEVTEKQVANQYGFALINFTDEDQLAEMFFAGKKNNQGNLSVDRFAHLRLLCQKLW